MTHALLTQLTLILSIVLQLFILTLLIRRRLKQRFFWFFIYILFQICEAAVRFSVAANKNLYGKVYWSTDLADLVLGVIAFRESFLNVLRPYTRLRWFVKTVWGCIGFGLFYAAFRTWAVASSKFTDSAFIGFEVAVNYSLSAAGILYLALVIFLQIKEQQWESAIVLGFTIYSIVGSCGYIAFSVFGANYSFVSTWITALGYLLGATIWAVGLWRPEPAVVAPVKNLHEKDLELLNRYATIMDLIFNKRKR
jgi:hypothetical protein